MKLFDIFKSKTNVRSLYSEKELEIYENFIKTQFGDYETVLHELVSPDIHLDVVIIPPTDRNNYYTLVTMGMGAHKMSVPKAYKKFNLEHAELVLHLPPTWKIDSDKDEDCWPIKQLMTSARVPVQYDTWLGYAHTLAADADCTPYAPNTKLCSIILSLAVNKNNEELNLSLKNKGKIRFYQLVPIYKEELEYSQKMGADALFELFENNKVLPIVDIDRESLVNSN